MAVSPFVVIQKKRPKGRAFLGKKREKTTFFLRILCLTTQNTALLVVFPLIRGDN